MKKAPTATVRTAREPTMSQANATKPEIENFSSMPTGQNIPYGDARYNSAMHFLIMESHLLDDGHFNDWLDLLANDIEYKMPVRQSVRRNRGSGFSSNMMWLQEDKPSLSFKVQRLYGDSAWAEDPPSRTRRLVTNMMLYETDVPDQFLARNYLLLHRNQGDARNYDVFSARRDDVLRQIGAGWLLAKRVILVDQAALGLANLAIFM